MMSADRATGQATEEERLQKYGWVDRDKKIVRIPIEQAMKLAIEQGWLRSAAPASGDRSQPEGSSQSPDGSRGAR
jgi:hypothetical protein